MNSDFLIVTTDTFDKSSRKLSKKYPSFAGDLVELKKILLENPFAGTPLGKNCYKIRLNISSKKSGKKGGGRVITFVRVQLKRITLLDVYDKSEKENITDKELSELISKAE